MPDAIEGAKIAILVANGSDEVETAVMLKVLEDARAEPVLVSVKKHEARGWRNTEWGGTFAVDVAILDADAEEFGGLLVPGGVIGADTLRADAYAVDFVRNFLNQRKPVATIGHAPWLLVEAGAVRGRRLTSIPAIRNDLIHAGGQWIDAPAVRDGRLVTGRTHHDLPEVVARFVEAAIFG